MTPGFHLLIQKSGHIWKMFLSYYICQKIISLFIHSDVQVPHLPLIWMYLYNKFKGRAPGCLTASGNMLQIHLMQEYKWPTLSLHISRHSWVWGYPQFYYLTWLIIILYLFFRAKTSLVTFRGRLTWPLMYSYFYFLSFNNLTFQGQIPG